MVKSREEVVEFALPKDTPFEIGGSDATRVSFGNLPHGVPLLATIEWVRAQSKWFIKKQLGSSCSISFEGGELPDSVPYLLIPQTIIKIGDCEVTFVRRLAAPTIEGISVDSIPVRDTGKIVFGRGSGEAEAGVIRVCLDADDLSISQKRHAEIETDRGQTGITDASKAGMLLNNSPFKKESLVYGDRFSIGDYVFEYLATRIRRVDQSPLGSVQARGLKKTVGGGLTILENINLDVNPGEFVGILGGSGQGKSTLMNALCGINPATEGKVWINGVEIADRAAMLAAGVGYVPQDDIVHRELTVIEAIRRSALLRLNLRGAALDALIDRIIQNLGLQSHREKRVRDLSGGQRKRVSIAAELLSRPSVLFLDEPTSGLDPWREFELMGWLQSLTLTGITVICTTHVMENAHLFNRLLLVQGGRVVFSGGHMAMREHFLSRWGGNPGSSTDAGSSQSSASRKLASMVKVYEEIETGNRSAAEWERLFVESKHYKPVDSEIRNTGARPSLDSSRRVGPMKTLWHLIARQWLVLKADRLNILFLLAQAVVIGILVGWVADSIVLRSFLAVVATLWFGCSNGAQQIVGELPIFRRERVSGQGLNPYVFSKFSFLTTLTALQSVVLLLVIYGSSHLFYERSFEEGKEDKFQKELARRLFPLTSQNTSLIEAKVAGTEGSGGGSLPVAELVPDRHGLFTLPGFPNQLFTVPAGEWQPNAERMLPTGERFRLPPNLPDYPDGGIQAASARPGCVESPFAKDAWSQVSRDLWKPGSPVRCEHTGLIFYLPKKLPAWPTETLRFRALGALIRYFELSDAFLDSGRSDERPELKDMPISRLLCFSLGLKIVTLMMTAFVGVAIGLTISALVQNGTQAVMWVPLVLIPQILFGGFVVKVPDMATSVRASCRVVPSFLAQRSMDVSHLFARIVPKVTNQSKMPIFTDGADDEIKWEIEQDGEKIPVTERYIKEAAENVSWQNLLVLPEKVGRRLIEERIVRLRVSPDKRIVDVSGYPRRDYTGWGSSTRSYTESDETVDRRDDVKLAYSHQNRFEYYGEAQMALAGLGAWLLACYSVILAGLYFKQTGK